VPAPFRYDRRFDFDVAPGVLWDTLRRTDEYSTWWPWLRDLEGGGLQEGAVVHCVVQAPLPYALRFDVVVQRVVPHHRVETVVRGDLDGPALLEIAPYGDGSTARLEWTLELRDRVLRPLSSLARPAMVWAHDRVIEVGLREFERRVLDGHGP
jgi:hypothetical protein